MITGVIVLGGRKIKQQLSVYVKVVAQVIYNGKEHVKNISSSEEAGYAAGMAVKEEESFEFVYGELINKANNKALMILNRFLEEIGI